MEILGLDKIRKISDNTDLEPEIIGLDMIRPEEDSISVTGLDKIRTIIETDLPRLSSFARELIELVGRVRDLDTDFRQFGARHHRYEFAPVIPLSDVRDFEARHSIRLPQGYVDYLTQVGNGGAGPEHGIFSLEEVEKKAYFDHKNALCPIGEAQAQPDFYTLPYGSEGSLPLVDSALTQEKWDQWYMALQSSEGEAYDEMYRRGYRGLVQIMEAADGSGYMLACEGDLSGEMILVRREMDCPEPLGRTFEEYVLSHFRSMAESLERQRCRC